MEPYVIMEKVFSSSRSFVNVKENPKFCLSCGNMATKEILFDVGNAALIEKYCETCAERRVN
jgi:hypothetical protein